MAMKTFEKVEAIVTDLISSGQPLRNHFGEIDDIIHNKWELPPELNLDWIVPVRSSDASTAFYTAERALSIEEPEVFVTQTTPGEKNADKVDDMERWMKWQYKMARRRAEKDPYTDKVHSGLRYDIICGQVIHIKNEVEATEMLDPDSLKYNLKAGTGDFAIRMANPKNVYVKKNLISGLDTIVHVYQTRVSDVQGTWGAQADELVASCDDDKDPLVIVYDYTCLRDKQRLVWVKKESMGEEYTTGGGEWVIVDAEWKLPFLNWFFVSGGTSLEDEGEYAVNPLLGRLARTGMYDLQCMMDSLVVSEAVATAGYPRFGIVGPNGDMVEVVYHDPARLMQVPDGHSIVDLRERRLDEGMLHLSDRIKARVDRETVARFLQNLDLPDRAAYASINAVMQAAVAALDRYKRLVERALSDMFQIMFWFIHFRQETSIGFAEAGKQVALGWDTFDPEYIFVEVECQAKTPSDYMQKINAGRMLLEMGAPLEDVFKFVGFNNPKDMMERKAMDSLRQFELNLRMGEEKAQSDMKIRASMMEAEMELRKKLAPPPSPGGAPTSGGAGQGGRTPQPNQMGDQGMNTAMGGSSPSTADSNNLREMVQERGEGGIG